MPPIQNEMAESDMPTWVREHSLLETHRYDWPAEVKVRRMMLDERWVQDDPWYHVVVVVDPPRSRMRVTSPEVSRLTLDIVRAFLDAGADGTVDVSFLTERDLAEARGGRCGCRGHCGIGSWVSYPDDLIGQARHLLGRGRRRPKQVDLRRAVSAAYYAVFHALTLAGAKRMSGPRASAAAVNAIARTFEHGTMSKAARELIKTTPEPKLRALLGATKVSPDVALICSRFESLQKRRHAADYNLADMLLKQDAADVVDLAEDTLRLIVGASSDTSFDCCLIAMHSYHRLRT